MIRAGNAFNHNIRRVRNLGGLYQALSNMTTAAVDATDLLRAQHVLCVSALDHYIHEVARIGMMEIFDGHRPPTEAFGRFRVSVGTLAGSGTMGLARANFEAEIREQHSYLSFQQPDKIADAIRLVKDVELWRCVGETLGRPPKDVKDHLKLIVDRRNKIAHEADTDPTNPNQRWPISAPDVDTTVNFIVDMVGAIHPLVI